MEWPDRHPTAFFCQPQHPGFEDINPSTLSRALLPSPSFNRYFTSLPTSPTFLLHTHPNLYSKWFKSPFFPPSSSLDWPSPPLLPEGTSPRSRRTSPYVPVLRAAPVAQMADLLSLLPSIQDISNKVTALDTSLSASLNYFSALVRLLLRQMEADPVC